MKRNYDLPTASSEVGDILRKTNSYDVYDMEPAIPRILRLGINNIEEAQKLASESSSSRVVIVNNARVSKVTRVVYKI